MVHFLFFRALCRIQALSTVKWDRLAAFPNPKVTLPGKRKQATAFDVKSISSKSLTVNICYRSANAKSTFPSL